MRNCRTTTLVIIACIAATLDVHAQIRMPVCFTDNMMLQRNSPVAVWGDATLGSEITVRYTPRPGSGQAQQTAKTKVDKSGKWRLQLKPIAASFTSGQLAVHSTLDTHFYVATWNKPYTGYADWKSGKHASRLRLDKPMVIGEIGVFRDAVDYDLGKGMWLLADFQAETYKHLNARGWLHWLWDARGFEAFWSDQWLIDRNPANWMGPTGRPDPAAPPLAYKRIPAKLPAPPPAPLGPPARFEVSKGATLTTTPYGYLLAAPKAGTFAARRRLDKPCVKRLDLQATVHYDRAKHRCATLRIGDSVADRWVELELVWDGAQCRLEGNATAKEKVSISRPPIPYDGHMFSSRITVSADLTAKKVMLTFNDKKAVTKDLLGLQRIDAIEIVRNHDARSHVAITKLDADEPSRE